MLNSKQRAFLRGLANRIDTILIVGKGEITDNIIKQADDALTAREIIKGKVLENSAYSSRRSCRSYRRKMFCGCCSGNRFKICTLQKKR